MTLTKARKTTLHALPLEAREVPAAFLSGGYLHIEGSDYADTVTVRYRGDVDEMVEVTIETQYPRRPAPGKRPGTPPKPALGPVRSVQYFAAPEVHDILFSGNGGNDVFRNEFVLPAGGRVQADGGAGHDRLQSVSPRTPEFGAGIFLTGGPGNDVLVGGTGANYLGGGDGNDSLYGGAANDALYGEGGAD